MWRFFVMFSLILIALFSLELLKSVQAWAVMPWTDMLARISAAPLVFF